MKTLSQLVSGHLDFLKNEKHFRIKNSHTDNKYGDGIIELINEQLLVQLIKDRGQIEIYFANADHTDDLFELSELYEIYSGKAPQHDSASQEAVNFMKEHFSSVIDLLTTKRLASLAKRDKMRIKKLKELGFNNKKTGS